MTNIISTHHYKGNKVLTSTDKLCRGCMPEETILAAYKLMKKYSSISLNELGSS